MILPVHDTLARVIFSEAMRVLVALVGGYTMGLWTWMALRALRRALDPFVKGRSRQAHEGRGDRVFAVRR